MEQTPWDQRVLGFLKRTGDDLRRTGEELRAEAQKLIEEVKDPQNQAKVKDALKDLGTWARKSAEEAGTKIESAMKEAEVAFTKASKKLGETFDPSKVPFIRDARPFDDRGPSSSVAPKPAPKRRSPAKSGAKKTAKKRS